MRPVTIPSEVPGGGVGTTPKDLENPATTYLGSVTIITQSIIRVGSPYKGEAVQAFFFRVAT